MITEREKYLMEAWASEPATEIELNQWLKSDYGDDTVEKALSNAADRYVAAKNPVPSFTGLFLDTGDMIAIVLVMCWFMWMPYGI